MFPANRTKCDSRFWARKLLWYYLTTYQLCYDTKLVLLVDPPKFQYYTTFPSTLSLRKLLIYPLVVKVQIFCVFINFLLYFNTIKDAKIKLISACFFKFEILLQMDPRELLELFLIHTILLDPFIYHSLTRIFKEGYTQEFHYSWNIPT